MYSILQLAASNLFSSEIDLNSSDDIVLFIYDLFPFIQLLFRKEAIFISKQDVSNPCETTATIGSYSCIESFVKLHFTLIRENGISET
jgi:hypothetical protein